MQELEKILAEIETHREFASEHENFNVASAFELCVEIIRKHISGKDMNVSTNDGWIPVEERFPEYEEQCRNDDRGNQYMKRLEIAYMTDTVEYTFGYYDGYKWIDKRHNIISNVVAWRIHKSYHPERSEEAGDEVHSVLERREG